MVCIWVRFISLGIPSEHFFWFGTKDYSPDSCFEFLCFLGKCKCSVMSRPTPYVPPDGTRNHFISLGIPSDSMWNSKWKYLSGLRPKTILMIAVSDIYAFRTTSSDLWCGDRLCVPSEAILFLLEFQVILCDSKWNSKWRYLCKKVLPLYLFRIFRLSVRIRMLWGAEIHRMCYSILLICISLGIPSDSMWNSKWTYFCGMRQKSILMVVVLYLYGFWKSSSALWCGGHRICRDNFTWNFT